jgi:hypothetical protein
VTAARWVPCAASKGLPLRDAAVPRGTITTWSLGSSSPRHFDAWASWQWWGPVVFGLTPGLRSVTVPRCGGGCMFLALRCQAT